MVMKKFTEEYLKYLVADGDRAAAWEKVRKRVARLSKEQVKKMFERELREPTEKYYKNTKRFPKAMTKDKRGNWRWRMNVGNRCCELQRWAKDGVKRRRAGQRQGTVQIGDVVAGVFIRDGRGVLDEDKVIAIVQCLFTLTDDEELMRRAYESGVRALKRKKLAG